MSRAGASLCFGVLCGMVAADAGLPFWRDWPWGDVSDFAVTGFWFCFLLIGSLRTKVIINQFHDSGRS